MNPDWKNCVFICFLHSAMQIYIIFAESNDNDYEKNSDNIVGSDCRCYP